MAVLTPEAPQDLDIIDRVSIHPSVAAAAADALAAGHANVNPENLAIGAVQTDASVASALERQNISVEAFQLAVTTATGRDYDSPVTYHPFYSPSTRHMLETAVGLAERSGRTLTGRHILLSVIEEGDGVLDEVFNSLKVNADQFTDDLRQPIADPFEAETETSPLVVSMKGLLNEIKGESELESEVAARINELREQIRQYKESIKQELASAVS